MSHALSFNGVTLAPVNHGNQLWIRAAELARALGYASEKSVSNLYARNADEFSNDMTVVIDLMTSDTPTKTRLFSPRGCHLIAMFARTPVAKAFRKWVLDVLDKLTVQVALPVAKAKKPAQKALPDPATLLAVHAVKVQAAMLEVRSRGTEFIAAVLRLQTVIHRPVTTDIYASPLAKALERNLPVFGTSIGMNVSALSELMEVYEESLSTVSENRA